MSYTGCNVLVKRDLHPAAFFPVDKGAILSYMARKALPKPAPARHFIKQWRHHRQLTQAQLVARLEEIGGPGVPTTTASLSRIESGKQPYDERLLWALAEILQTDVASLLMRDPTDADAMWSIWDQASPGERQQIRSLAETVIKFRTGTGG